MEFAGDFTYAPVGVTDDDMEEVEVVLNEDDADEDVLPPAPAAAPRGRAEAQFQERIATKRQHVAKHKIKKANTNVLGINLSTLASDAELVPGDPTFCASCRAVFSVHSRVEQNGMWACEFCHTSNIVSEMDEDEKPKNPDVDYLLEPAPVSASSAGAQSPIVIFAVDISGSMCCTTEVPGTFKLKGGRDTSSLLQAGDDRHQYLPGANRDITFVSRLQCVQAAIEAQLGMMATDTPNARVALVTFSRDVTIYGDGLSNHPVVISGDKLNSYDQLIAIGEQNKTLKPISESKAKILDILMKLEEDGSTALGPAIAVCLGMARGSYGSRIVLATDGLSNTGIGAMDEESGMHAAQEYYDKISVVALGQSTTINIVGIRGGDSVRMSVLGKMADATQGEVNLVDPLNIVSEFASMLQAKIIATNVNVKLLLHKGLSLVHIDASQLLQQQQQQQQQQQPKEEESANSDRKNGENVTERTVGNAYEDSELTFEYEVRSSQQLDELFKERAQILGMEGSLPEELKKLPFQVQITYTKLDGSKCIRVITKTQNVTHDRQQAERTVKAAMLGTHAWATSAALAEQGHYEAAMVNNALMTNVLSRAPVSASHTAQYATGTESFNQVMRQGIQQQAARAVTAPQQPQQQGQPSYGQAVDDDFVSTHVLQFKSARQAKKGMR